jgi:amidophosphoribosyltransferase
MSENIHHECGIALIRLLKPLEYYQQKYSTALYGLNKLYLMMEKQHNRGQDGAGIACIKFDTKPGQKFINRYRSNSNQPILDIFENVNSQFHPLQQYNPHLLNNVDWLKENCEFVGELYLGHLRYGTYGGNNIDSCHPFVRHNNWKTRNLVVAGNFNLTNVDELFNFLVSIGQHPIEMSDTVTVMEKIGHFLDEENEAQFENFRPQGYSYKQLSPLIAQHLDIQQILQNASDQWDGGYVMAGLLGHGDSFVLRDPNGIRPAFYYQDDEVVVVASERPVIQTAFKVAARNINEIKPGHALIIKKDGQVGEFLIREPLEKKSCTFERIYFSRGSDREIYKERKMLGKLLSPAVLKSIHNDFENTIFSFIPNTAEVAFYGMVEGIHEYLNNVKKEKIKSLGSIISDVQIDEILSVKPRVEKLAIKDVKLRTFIAQDVVRDDMVAHVYDVTYGCVRNDKDTIVVIDDSIVRGTTLKQSIFKMLDRLHPKKIVIISSAPQIRYPDCYGIDMARLDNFIAFTAAIELLKDDGLEHIIDEVYKKCKAQEKLPKEKMANHVKEIYQVFSDEKISQKIAALLRPAEIKAEVEIIYQSLENLHRACPNHKGDWYFSGNYPTPGGNKVVNKAFINYIEGKKDRAY